MAERATKILLVEPEPDLTEMLVEAMARRFQAQITCVADGESCLDVEIVAPHDLVITEQSLPDTSGVHLAEQLTCLSNRPIILLSDEPTGCEAIKAMRGGVRDIFAKPFAVAELLDTVDRLLQGQTIHRLHVAKYHRMRDLVRRMIQERRDLNQRIDLICRDLVGSQRRLVRRVVAMEETMAKGTA